VFSTFFNPQKRDASLNICPTVKGWFTERLGLLESDLAPLASNNQLGPAEIKQVLLNYIITYIYIYIY